MFETDDNIDLDAELKKLVPARSPVSKKELLDLIDSLMSEHLTEWQEDFLISVKAQLKFKGFLSNKQVAVLNSMGDDVDLQDCGVDWHDLF